MKYMPDEKKLNSDFKIDFKRQISDIDHSFYNYFGFIYSEKLLCNDIELLEKMLKTISRVVTFYKIFCNYSVEQI